MLVTNSDDLFARVVSLWDHGRDPNRQFWINQLGFKYKMSERAGGHRTRTARARGRADRGEAPCVRLVRRGARRRPAHYPESRGARRRSIYWMTSILLDPAAGISRDELRTALKERNIDTRPVFPAISQYPIWNRSAARPARPRRVSARRASTYRAASACDDSKWSTSPRRSRISWRLRDEGVRLHRRLPARAGRAARLRGRRRHDRPPARLAVPRRAARGSSACTTSRRPPSPPTRSGRMTGVPGVAMATSGPGATNLLTGIGSCYFDSTPAVFITGQVNRHEQKGDRDRSASSASRRPTSSPWRRRSRRRPGVSTHADEIPERLADAFRPAVSGRPGPVLVDIPIDVQRADAPTPPPVRVDRRRACPVTWTPSVDDSCDALAAARAPADPGRRRHSRRAVRRQRSGGSSIGWTCRSSARCMAVDVLPLRPPAAASA